MCNLYLMYYKVYRNGKSRSHRHYSSECMDVEYGISISRLKFPANSDQLPENLKTNETHNHHHNHQHHGMMGDNHDVMGLDNGLTGHHHGLRGSDFDDDDERDEENEGDEEGEPGDDDGDLDDENNLLTNEPSNENDRSSDHDDSTTGFDFGSPDEKDADDRLIREDPSSHNSPSASTTSSDHVSGEKKKKGKKDTKKESNHTADSNKNKFHDVIDSDLDSLTVSTKDHRKKVNVAKAVEMPQVDGDWPYYREKWKNAGQISALGMDGKNMLLLHRGGRVWGDKQVAFINFCC